MTDQIQVTDCYLLADPSNRSLGTVSERTGRGAAWLARLSGGQEVPSSNLGAPTLQKVPSSNLGARSKSPAKRGFSAAHFAMASALQPKTNAAWRSSGSTPESDGCSRSSSTSGQVSRPSEAAPSSAPQQR